MNPNNPATVSDICLKLITDAEHLSCNAYLCPNNYLTIGWGHRLIPKADCGLFHITGEHLFRLINDSQACRKVTPEAAKVLNISREQALVLLSRDVSQTALFLRSITQAPLTQNQFDALVSFVYNIGQGQYAQSTLRKKLEQGDQTGAAEEFDHWVHIKNERGVKIVAPGLVTRRATERALFEQPQ